MKERKCIHPRKAYNLMKTFLNDASDLHYADDENNLFKTEIILKKSDSFKTESGDSLADSEELEVNYNFQDLCSNGAKIFRACWTRRVPCLKGFSDATLALLHELGHLETNDKVREYFPYFMRELTMVGIENVATCLEEANAMYFLMPDEKAATEWAINWLSKKENSKKAKLFEKEFFKCFE